MMLLGPNPFGGVWVLAVVLPGMVVSIGQLATSFQLPANSEADGTHMCLDRPRISLSHSSAQKKNSLPFLMGPPMVEPKSSRRSEPCLPATAPVQPPGAQACAGATK